jgi:hypothetical protein
MTHSAFLLVHLDLGNSSLAGELASARLRKLRKQGLRFAFEQPLLELVESLGQSPLAADRKALLLQAREALKATHADSDYRVYLPVDEWLAAQLSGRRLLDIIREQSQGLPRIPAGA